jgi:glycerol-3-phosphate acyltransferase PlsY
MDASTFTVLASLAGYLIGSLSFAVIVSRVMRLDDPRTYGSKNPGATNVLRSGNRMAAVLTLVLDALKGYAPVVLAGWYATEHRFSFDAIDWVLAGVGLAAFLGHLWPVFFRFRGGKGVATAVGVLFGLNPWLGLATLATWLIIAAFFRYSSLASLVAAAFAPFYQLFGWGGGPIALALVVMAFLLFWRHAGNIRKLVAGTESKLGARASASASVAPAAPPAARGRRERSR